MATTFEVCDESVEKLARQIMGKWHPDLVNAQVSVSFIFAKNTEAPAIMANGYPAFAQVKINGLKERVEGLRDARILIDEDQWEEASDETKAAVLDHELQHLEPQRDQRGDWKRDDAGRPKLRLRKHDFQLGGFLIISKRHGLDAVEVQAVRAIQTKWEQMELPFANEMATA